VNWKGPRETGGLFYSRFDFLVAKISETTAVFATRKTKKMYSAAGGFCQRTEIQLDHIGVTKQLATGAGVGIATLIEHISPIHDL
jgi:hypothetical protein